jgi:hypothetical protein
MIRPPPISIEFLTHDPKWRIAFERFRSPRTLWQARVLGDWNELVARNDERPNALSVIEISAAELRTWLLRITRLRHWWPEHRFMVVGAADLRPFAGIFLEAGAVGCGFSVRDCPRLAQIAERLALVFPPRPLGLRDAIFGALPWPTVAQDVPAE